MILLVGLVQPEDTNQRTECIGLTGQNQELGWWRPTVWPFTLYGDADIVKVVVVGFIPGLKVPLGDSLQAVPV